MRQAYSLFALSVVFLLMWAMIYAALCFLVWQALPY